MREDSLHQIFFSGFQLTPNHIALDQLCDLRTNHMRTQKLAGFGIKHGFNHSFRLAQSNRLAVANEGKAADFKLEASLFCLGLGHADAGDLRMAIGAASNRAGLDRMRMAARDQLGHHHAFVAGLMRKPWRACDIANGVKPLDAGAAEFIGDDMGAVDLNAQSL